MELPFYLQRSPKN